MWPFISLFQRPHCSLCFLTEARQDRGWKENCHKEIISLMMTCSTFSMWIKRLHQNFLQRFYFISGAAKIFINICDIGQLRLCQFFIKLENFLTHPTLMTTIKQLDSVHCTLGYNCKQFQSPWENRYHFWAARAAPVNMLTGYSLSPVKTLKDYADISGCFLLAVFPRVWWQHECHLCA